jgi:hypothetical protein
MSWLSVLTLHDGIKTYSIDLSRENALIVELVLEYLYCCDYSYTENSVQRANEQEIPREANRAADCQLDGSDSTTLIGSEHDVDQDVPHLPGLKRPRKKPQKRKRPPKTDCPVLQTNRDHLDLRHSQRSGIGIVIHAGVWSFADRYDIDCLRGVALSKLEMEMEFEWKSDWFLFLACQVFPSRGSGPDVRLEPLRELILLALLGNREFLDVRWHPDTVESLPGLYHNLLICLRREKKI